MNAHDFKQAARRFASGVTVVTTRRDREVYRITVSAFATLSLEPLQVLVSISANSRLHDMIRGSGAFAINILREDQRPISQCFATPGRATCIDAFPNVACRTCAMGAPVIEDCLAHFDCRLTATYPSSDGEPLLYFDGDYPDFIERHERFLVTTTSGPLHPQVGGSRRAVR